MPHSCRCHIVSRVMDTQHSDSMRNAHNSTICDDFLPFTGPRFTEEECDEYRECPGDQRCALVVFAGGMIFESIEVELRCVPSESPNCDDKECNANELCVLNTSIGSNLVGFTAE